MWVLLLSLLLLGVGCYIADRWMRRKGYLTEKPSSEVKVEEEEGECCGQHEICEKDSLILMNEDIVYYDDEELDRYSGVSLADYTEEAYNEFADVLYTLKEEEVAGWIRSLTLRKIELPEELKEEALLIVRERRFVP